MTVHGPVKKQRPDGMSHRGWWWCHLVTGARSARSLHTWGGGGTTSLFMANDEHPFCLMCCGRVPAPAIPPHSHRPQGGLGGLTPPRRTWKVRSLPFSCLLFSLQAPKHRVPPHSSCSGSKASGPRTPCPWPPVWVCVCVCARDGQASPFPRLLFGGKLTRSVANSLQRPAGPACGHDGLTSHAHEKV